MIWDSWGDDAELRRLEQALAAVGTTIVKTHDYVRIGSFSKTKIFDVATFKRVAAEVLRAKAGRDPGAGTRRQGAQERPSANRRGAQGAGVTLADIEQADGDLMRLVTQALAERDAWRTRATAAEAQLASRSGPGSGGASATAIGRIKRQLALVLHPDATGDERDKQIRSELFKQVWPLIEQLESL